METSQRNEIKNLIGQLMDLRLDLESILGGLKAEGMAPGLQSERGESPENDSTGIRDAINSIDSALNDLESLVE